MRIALQPAALNDRKVAQHYEDTINNRVRYSGFADVLDPQVLRNLDALFPQRTAQFWGVTPGRSDVNVRSWTRLEPGDAVFFYGQKRLYLAGYIALPFRNQAFAELLWGRTNDGLTWELMFALTGLRDVTVPIEEVRAALGWGDRAFIQGFTVVRDEKAERLAELVNLDIPVDVPLSAATSESQPPAPPDGPTDGWRTSSWRREHPALKRRLVELGGGTCAICGSRVPAEFLVGAHIKKRSFCSETERKDFDNVGMLACLLGCDSLFERGFIAIAPGGTILISNAVETAPDVSRFVKERLLGRRSAWWNNDREKYYAWHREHVFIRNHAGVEPSYQSS